MPITNLIRVRAEPPSANWASNAATTANTPLNVFTPASNVNGCILLGGHIASMSATDTAESSFIAKSSAPTSIVDGDIVLGAVHTMQVSTQYAAGAVITKDHFIPAGQGLYFISGKALAGTHSSRAVRYRML